MVSIKSLMAWVFASFFLIATLFLAGAIVYQSVEQIIAGDGMTTIMIAAINKAVIALATFELGVGIAGEYTSNDDENIYSNVRRTATRFIGVASIALVLEALIMVIKYSQLELAGNLFYPVAVLLGAGGLLISLGIFLFLTHRDGAAHHQLAERSSSGLASRPTLAAAALGAGHGGA